MSPITFVFSTIAASMSPLDKDFPPYLIWTVFNDERERLVKGVATIARDDLAQLAFDTKLESANELDPRLAADVRQLECVVISAAELASITRESVENAQAVLEADNAFGLWLRGKVPDSGTPFESVRVSVNALMRMRA